VSQKSTELQQLMLRAGISSFRTLSDRSQISRRGIDRVRQQQAQNLKYADLLRLSQVLQISFDNLIKIFSSEEITSEAVTLDALQQECDRLLIKLSEQQKTLKAELINEILQKLESLLVQFPTAIYAANQNPSLPARNLILLLRPLDFLLQSWNIEQIGEVGSTIDFDPQWHSLIESAQVEPGQSVLVRYVGYRQIEDQLDGQQLRLLFRAKVSPK
jgi:transcriptional regulator with XRE-family HTH domain